MEKAITLCEEFEAEGVIVIVIGSRTLGDGFAAVQRSGDQILALHPPDAATWLEEIAVSLRAEEEPQRRRKRPRPEGGGGGS